MNINDTFHETRSLRKSDVPEWVPPSGAALPEDDADARPRTADTRRFDQRPDETAYSLEGFRLQSAVPDERFTFDDPHLGRLRLLEVGVDGPVLKDCPRRVRA